MKTVKNKMSWTGSPGHTPQGVSETIQGDVLSLAKILQRYSNGIEPPRGSAFYGDVEDDEHESDDYNRVVNSDLVDKDEMLADRIALLDVIEAKKKEKAASKKEEVKNEPQSP